MVYFSTRASVPPRAPSPPDSPARPNGVLGPQALSHSRTPSLVASTSAAYSPFHKSSKRHSSHSRTLPGGRLNFVKFETTDLTSCIAFIATLISSSAAANKVPLQLMKQNVKIMATGGGAHLFHDRLRDELGVEVRREDELECLVLGLGFVMEVPDEVFWYSDELVQAISHPHAPVVPSTSDSTDPFPRPSPNPPQYSLSFDSHPTPAQFPCLLVNIGSGVSIIKVDDYGKFERISGTSLGGGTLWGLLSLLTGAKSFDGGSNRSHRSQNDAERLLFTEMLTLADKGDNSSVDMLVGDIYGQDYQKIGLKSSTIASSFGKVFRKGARSDSSEAEVDAEVPVEEKPSFKAEDISKSLLYAISNNIGQIA